MFANAIDGMYGIGHFLAYGISIISKDNMIKYRNIVGKKPLFYKVDEIEAVDVDTPLDFEFAEFLYKKYKK